MRRFAVLCSGLCWLLIAACSSVRGLDAPGRAARLAGDESARVEAQVERAMDAGEWTAAWNQAADLEASRETLERIALGALAADDGAGADMLDALRAKWGSLSPEGQERMRGIIGEAEARNDWSRAAEVALLAADDAPAYTSAWGVYELAPPDEAPGILEAILEARAGSAE